MSTDGQIVYSDISLDNWSSGKGLPYDKEMFGEWRDLEYCKGYFYAMSEKGFVSRSATGISDWKEVYNVGQGKRTTGNGRLRCDKANGRLIASRINGDNDKGFHVMDADITQRDYIPIGNELFRGAAAYDNSVIVGGKGDTSYYLHLDNCVLSWYKPDGVYEITYNLNGGKGGGMSARYAGGAVATSLGTPPTRDNSKFSGWHQLADFSDKAISEIPSGSTGSKTLYAKWLCNGGYYASTQSECAAVGENYYSPDDDNSRTACAAGKISEGSGSGADNADDCAAYRTLHNGANSNTVRIRTIKRTTPSLNVMIGTDIYYGSLQLGAKTGHIAIKAGDKIYSLVD
jgi:uncharacterized repeat protein (TIGR02543 family)